MSENGESAKLCPVMSMACRGMECEWYGHGCPAHPTTIEYVQAGSNELPDVQVLVTVMNDSARVRRATFQYGTLQSREYLSQSGEWLPLGPGREYPPASKLEAKVYDSAGRQQ